VIFVSHDRHFIDNLATAVLEVKNGTARFLPGDYEYYLRRVSREAEEEEPPSRRRRPEAGEKAPTPTQLERQEEKKLKSVLRSLEREEEELLKRLEALEEARREIEASMARPDAYADGARMRALDRAHMLNQEEHAEAMTRWEAIAARIGELKVRIAGLRNDKASR